MQLRIAPLAPAVLPVLPPDIVWDAQLQVGDCVLATDPSQGGVGGFQAMNPIGTAVTLCLMSDARIPRAMLKPGLGGDRRGWPGDGVDVDAANGETPLGSYWWAMKRDRLDEAVAQAFLAEGLRALQPLQAQKLCAAIAGQVALLDIPNGLLELAYQLTGIDGNQIFAGSFRPLWQRANGL